LKQSEERKQAILQLLQQENRVYVSDLSDEFEISEVTIRKDLKELEDRALLRRIHGGATNFLDKAAIEDSLDKLMQSHVEEKKRIAKCAYSYINDGDSILLDASTTTRELVHLIKEGGRKDLTIITPAVQISNELASCEHLQIIQLSGIVRRTLYTVMGPLTTESLRKIHVDKSFIGVNGVDPAVGLTTQNMLECEIKKHIIEASTQSFVLADASKMRCVALSVICPTNRVDYIITDERVSLSFSRQLEESGVEVIIAGP
jgi:DeoR family fructose operon transcriptional repressor